jgi:aryl-alcohol dehydrogenase-like predicted oxidoreductase
MSQEASMKNRGKVRSMNRRDFLKAGVAGAAAASFGLGGLDGLLHAESGPGLVYRTLGRTGLRATTLSFGAMLTPEYEVIRAGIDAGINYIDTARRYLNGRSESIVGRAVKGVRDKVYIATKTKPDSNTKDTIVKDVETSLENLGTDHIDVIQLHNLDSQKRAFIPEVREAYADLRKQGKVRFLGVTTHTNQAEVINAVVDDPDKFFDTVLVAYNAKSEPPVREAIARAKAAGIGIIAMKIQMGGYPRGKEPVSPEQAAAALKWVLQDPNVTCAIAGMKTLDHVRQMMPVMGSQLTGTDARVLERYAGDIDSFYCRLCARCEPTCPKGVGISVVNRALMYAEGYREYALARATFDEARGAGRCSTCTACVARCVHGLDIAGKMRKAESFFA